MKSAVSSTNWSRRAALMAGLAVMFLSNADSFTSPVALSHSRCSKLSVASSVDESHTRTSGGENDQAEYGKSLPLPDTFVRCSKCQAHFALRPEDLGTRGKGRRVECSLCNHSWFQARDKLMNMRDGFELQPLDDHQTNLVEENLKAGRAANFAGDFKIYVGNLDFSVEEADLVAAFSDCGEVGEVSVVRDHTTGRSRGFAFVTMMTQEGGQKAMEQMDGAELNGRSLTVKEPNS